MSPNTASTEVGGTRARHENGADDATPMRRRTRAPLGQGVRAPLSHRVGEALIHAMALAAVLAIALIFLFIARQALPLLWDAAAQEEIGGLSSLVVPRAWPGYDAPTFVWQPVGDVPKLNVVPLFVGTLKVTLLAMLFAVPLGVGAAVYVSQYATRRAREVLKPAIELLASIPSVVLGFLALMFLATFVQDALGTTYRLNVIVASLGLAIAVAPVVFTLSEDAISAVPRDLVHAALALGARKHQVILRVVLPAALPGISAAILLGMGRAMGETLVVLMASGNAAVMELFDPSSSARTVTATIAAELGEVAEGGAHWRVLFLLGALLFLVTFVLNRASTLVFERLHRRLRGDAR